MIQNTTRFASYFIQMMFTVFILFFLTVELGKVSADLLTYMNDTKISKPISRWVLFAVGAPLATAIWCMFWIWFKISEKKCIEMLSR